MIRFGTLLELICVINIVLSYYLQHFFAEAWKKYGRKWQKILSREKKKCVLIFIKYLFKWSHLKD